MNISLSSEELMILNHALSAWYSSTDDEAVKALKEKLIEIHIQSKL